MSRPRHYLLLEEWPPACRQAFERAFEAGGLFDPQGQAAHWAPVTRISVLKAYGRWLAYFSDTRHPIEEMDISERVSVEALGS
jgi:hypothetical protein